MGAGEWAKVRWQRKKEEEPPPEEEKPEVRFRRFTMISRELREKAVGLSAGSVKMLLMMSLHLQYNSGLVKWKRRSEITLRDLAEMCGVNRGRAGELLKELEGKGLIIREERRIWMNPQYISCGTRTGKGLEEKFEQKRQN